MALWKHFIVLFGGFIDIGVRSTSTISPDTQRMLTSIGLSELLERRMDL